MALMRWQIQMPKLIKNSNVYLPGKSETHYVSIAYITMKQVESNLYRVNSYAIVEIAFT